MGSALGQRAGACAGLACIKKRGQEYLTNPIATVFSQSTGPDGENMWKQDSSRLEEFSFQFWCQLEISEFSSLS